ncbi:hypothetical protein D3C78_1526570 [compost metagenome]
MRIGLGHFLTQAMASCREAHFQIQKPATNSFVAANGPLMTRRSWPEKATRAPRALGCRPSPASITPAWTSSSLKAPIAANSSCVGITPASLSFVALTITMNRMWISPG